MIDPSQIKVLEDLKRSAIRWIASHGLGTPEAEDIFQQSLLKAIDSSTSAESPEKVTAWFYRILRNTMTDEFRKNQADARRNEAYAAEIRPELDSETTENLCRCVSGLMGDLPAAERKILEGHFFDGKKFKELSAEFGQAEGAIRVKALRAREKLKQSLQACCNMTRFADAEDCGCA